MIWQEWSIGLAGTAPARRLRALPARLWRSHRVLSVICVAALAVYVLEQAGLLPSSLRTLTGEYGLPHVETLSTVLSRYRYYLSRVAMGTGLLALALALAWMVSTFVRPRDGARHALAVVCALGIVCMLLSLLAGGPDERYVLYAAAPVALGFAAGLGERAGVWAALGAIAVVLLIASVAWPALANPYDFFTYPSAIFYQRVMLQHLDQLKLPVSPEHVVEGAVLIVALAWILASRRPRIARPAAVALGVGVLAFCSVQSLYAMEKYAAGPGGGPGAAERSWVDEHVPAGTRVGALAVSLGESAFYVPVWESTEYWNTSVELDVSFGPPGSLPFPLGSEAMHLSIQPDSGLLSALAGPTTTTPVAPPEYMLVPLQGTNRIVLAGRVLAQSTYLPLELLRLSSPARAVWQIAGTSVEGFVTSGQAATATVYGGALAGLSRPCATFTLIAPPGFKGSWPYTVSSGRLLRRSSLRALQTATVSVPLFPRATPRGPSATLSVTVNGQASFAGIVASAKLAFFSVQACPASRG